MVKKEVSLRQPQPYFALKDFTFFKDQCTEHLIMTRFCSHMHTHRGRQIDLLCTCFPTQSNPSLSCESFHLSLIYMFIQVCKRACVLITVILPEDAAQSGDGGAAVWSAVAHLFSANRWFGPFQISDICRPSSYQKQTRPLPGGVKDKKQDP